MRPRDVLAANLKALMAATPGLGLLPEVTAASGGKLANGTLGRIRNAEVAVTIDKLSDLAEVFGVQPWQLLVEGLNPKELPRLASSQLLSDIRELLRAEQGGTAPIPETHFVTEPVKRGVGTQVGPALRKALDVPGSNTERGAVGRVSKQGTRRRA